MSSHSFPCGSYKTTVRKVTVCSGLFNTLRLTSCSGKRVCDCFTKGSVACCLTLSLDVHVLHGVLQSCMLYLSKLHLSKANLPRHAQHVYKMRMWTALGNVFALKAHVCTCGCSRWMSLWQLCCKAYILYVLVAAVGGRVCGSCAGAMAQGSAAV